MEFFFCFCFRPPQPGGPGAHIYIIQEQCGPVIPPGTGFPLHRLLRLAGLQWRYSNPPPHEPLRISSRFTIELYLSSGQLLNCCRGNICEFLRHVSGEITSDCIACAMGEAAEIHTFRHKM
jgi:hypothetical protein